MHCIEALYIAVYGCISLYIASPAFPERSAERVMFYCMQLIYEVLRGPKSLDIYGL